MMFGKGTRKNRKQAGKRRETRRRRLANLMSRQSQLEKLEERNLLAAYVVDVATDDAADISGVADGDLSLREAIIAANTNAVFGDAGAGAADGDTITFDPALAGATITLGNGIFTIADDLTIDGGIGGGRITLDADGLSGVLNVNTTGFVGASGDVSLSNLIVTDGGNVPFGGGIANTSTPLTLTDVDITDNTATDASAGLDIFGGSVTINGGTISGNTAVNSGGGIGLFNSATLQIDGTTLSGNEAPNGGALYLENSSSATVDNGIITGNTAGVSGSASGGGIFSDGDLTVTNTVIDFNVANRAGGGIEIGTNATSTTLTNVNLENNSALGNGSAPGNGGGLHVTGSSNVDIDGGFISGNSAAEEGGGLWNGNGTMTVTSVSGPATISFNTASGNFEPTSSNELQGGGGIFNNGGSLIVDGTVNGVTIFGNVADGQNTGPGTTAGSGGGIMSVGPGGNVMLTSTNVDFNEAVRAGGGIEVITGTVTITDSTINNNDVSPAGTIPTFSPGNGGGLHVTSGADVTLFGGTVENNTAGQEGGGLWNSTTGTMSIFGTNIQNNTAESANAAGDAQGGGGIFNNGGTLLIDGATITGNVALDPDAGGTSDDGGGGIFNDGGSVSIGGFTVVELNMAVDGLGNGGGILTLGGDVTVGLAQIVIEHGGPRRRRDREQCGNRDDQ